MVSFLTHRMSKLIVIKNLLPYVYSPFFPTPLPPPPTHYLPHQQTVRLEALFGDTEGNRGRILHEGDHRARWPEDIGIDLFDIATICLSLKAKERPDMDQGNQNVLGTRGVGIVE